MTHRRAIVLLLLAGAAAYANSLSGPFVLDDQASVVDATNIRRLWPLASALTAAPDSPLAGRPVASLSFAINYAIGGLDVRGYHLVNLGLHLCAALLLFAIVSGTLRLPSIRSDDPSATTVAFVSAVLWTVHPLDTEAVDYVTQRTELLMAVCLALTLGASLRAHESARARWWYAVAVGASAVGMACKESMAVAPVLVVLFDRAFVYPTFPSAFGARWRFYLALAATWGVLAGLLWPGPRAHSAGFGSGISPWTYLLNQCVIIPHYLRLALWPRDLVFIYGFPKSLALIDVLPSALLLVALGGLTLFAWRRRPAVGFLAAFAVITLAPASSVVPIATEVGAERRMYVPLTALIVLAVVSVQSLAPRTPRWRAAGWAVAGLVSIALVAATIDRNREYRSALGLAETALRRWPNAAAHHTVATELMLLGRTDEALPHLEAAVRELPRAHYTMGVALLDRQRWTEAIDHLQAFIAAEPALEQTGSARALIGQALVGRADAFMRQQRYGDAVEDYRAALSTGVRNAQAARNLALLLFNEGRYADAERHARMALELRPMDAVAHDLLGMALAAQARWIESIDHLEEAQRLDPANADVRDHLERVRRARGHP